MSLKFIMSQFGYAEEQGENKARADIYAVISPLLIPPGIQHPIECMLLRVIPGNEHCCVVSHLVIYMKTTQRSDDVRNGADKKELLIFHHRM